MRALIKYSLLLFSILFAVLLASCSVIPNINPYEQSFVGILGLLTPLLALINGVFLIIWILSRKYWFTSIPLAALVFSWNVYRVCFALHPGAAQDFTKDTARFSLMSYNVRLLDLYKWSKEKDTHEKILDFLAQKNPSVLCLQEFYTGNDSVGVNNIKLISEKCHYEYYATCDVNVNKRGNWGSVIFSHLPIVKSENHDIDVYGSNLLQQADIKINSDTVSIFNIHLKSNRFSADESELLNTNDVDLLNEKGKKKTQSIFRKLEISSVNRGLEADLVSNIISGNLNKKIVCGDLNDLPCSYVYFKMRHKMKDAFLEKGFGAGATYISAIPVLRIDYIFHTESIRLLGYSKFNIRYSDHYPLMVNFEI